MISPGGESGAGGKQGKSTGKFTVECLLGKGLRESVSPNRSITVFGAPLESQHASNWKSLPEIVKETDSFDLSSLTENHEVAVVTCNMQNLGHALKVYMWWTNLQNNKLLFDASYIIPEPDPNTGFVYTYKYFYSYIGWTQEEITENGWYRCNIWSDDFSFNLDFQVSGIPEDPEPPPPPPEKPFAIPDWLRTALYALNWDILTWKIYLGDAILTMLQWIVDGLNNAYLLGYQAWELVQGLPAKIQDVWDTLIKDLNFVKDELSNQISTWSANLADWWDTQVPKITTWIQAAEDRVLDKLTGFMSLDWFTSWWGDTKTNFSTWWDGAQTWIADRIETSMSSIRDTVNDHSQQLSTMADFFKSPVKFIWDRFIDWFFGED